VQFVVAVGHCFLLALPFPKEQGNNQDNDYDYGSNYPETAYSLIGFCDVCDFEKRFSTSCFTQLLQDSCAKRQKGYPRFLGVLVNLSVTLRTKYAYAIIDEFFI
jgi:hypothetical protein